MMLLVALALVADAGIPQTQMPTIGQLPERCTPKERRVNGKDKPTLSKLNEMPPAEPQYAVLREMDGCPIPAKVNAQKAKTR